MKEQAPKACALCSLPVELNIFTELTKDNQVLHFCCEGCKNIYRLINAEELKPEEKADKH
ncbi:heavy metal translocating P-type ATPase metal-binding domain-containing protein [Methylomarinum sp. Ch1-1]|uniref:Heavy metal translocating P-type ATPase metal-binding domain-containing protein n=1 Tax=Methylomarinum roseum TaxID=3067653 RepID=A0AAU7NW96_9GAMM|nr:heavy metal translocating P-type ATPase metal-binding domain-containing protein [Methylomarinum sp. Ch1-1]MDP4522616.1 heavy metal translocating P-type ATPase metal-binding domain-containing protein [Methylomarinum sp. Ch1-1]